jgi:hypothetical protein
MFRLFLIVCFSLLLAKGYSQADSVFVPSGYDSWNTGITFTLQLGAYVPISKLSNTLNPSPSIGFLFGLPITKRFRLDLGTSIFVPINSNRFRYSLPDTVLFAKPSLVCGVLGIYATHSNQINQKYFLDKIFGIGLGFIQTDKKIEKPQNEDKRNRSLETINLSFGLSVRKIVLKKRSIGLNISYNYTPYHLFQNRVNKDFGSQSFFTGLTYRF